jgi:hypothetical protein
MNALSKVLIIVLITIIAGCTSEVKNYDFVGKWTIVEYNTDNTKGLSKELIKAAKEVAMKSTYLLNEDNTFSSKVDKIGNKGTWEYNSELKILSLNGFLDKSGSKEKFIVEKVTKNKIHTTQNIPGFGSIKITLGKIKDE